MPSSIQHVCINLRSPQVRIPQLFLYRPYVGAVFEQVGSEAMPE